MAEVVDESVEVLVTRKFTVTFDDGSQYTDSITLPRTQHDALTPAQRKLMMRDRARAWRKELRDLAAAPQPTREERRAVLEERRLQMEQQQAEFAAQLAAEGMA